MLYKNLYLIGFIINIVSASSIVNPNMSEPMFVDGGMAHSKNLMEELLIYSNKVNDKFEKMEEVYKLSVEAIIKQYNIFFFAQEETFVFGARIPKNFNQSDVYEIILNIVAEHMPKNYSDETFSMHIFSKSNVALAESCVSALNLLIDFGNEKPCSRNNYTPSKPEKGFSVVYDPENPYDANVILAINWFIELIGNRYRGAYLYNYEIDIKVEDQDLVYNVVFCKGPSYTLANVPRYNFTFEFQEYCQALSQLDFVEMSEEETTTKFLKWADEKHKLELVECINESKEFFNSVFDVIRKYRMNEIEIYYFTHPGFLVPHHRKSINPLFCLTAEEEKLMRDLSVYPVKNTIIKPFIDLSYLYSPDELTKDIKCKDLIEREILLAVFARKFTSAYYTKKLEKYLNKVIQKHDKFTLEDEYRTKYFKEARHKMWQFIEDFDVARLCNLDNVPSETLESTIFKLYWIRIRTMEFLQRLAEITMKYETSDTTKDLNSLQSYQKEKKLEAIDDQLSSITYKIKDLFYSILFSVTDGIPRLIKLEEDLHTKKLRSKEITNNVVTDSGRENECKILVCEIKRLKNEILTLKQYLHQVRNDIFLASKQFWKSLYEFLVELKDY